MSTESNQSTSELFDASSESESLPGAESTTDDDNLGEEIDTNVSAAQLNRQKQIDSFKRKVESGELTIDEIPHDWIKKAVKSQVVSKEDIDSVVQKKVEETIKSREDGKTFTDLREKLNDANLTANQQAKVDAKYAYFIEKGLSKGEALENAIQTAGVTLEDTSRYAARIPRPSSKKLAPDEVLEQKFKEGEFPTDMPADERIKALERIRRGQR